MRTAIQHLVGRWARERRTIAHDRAAARPASQPCESEHDTVTYGRSAKMIEPQQRPLFSLFLSCFDARQEDRMTDRRYGLVLPAAAAPTRSEPRRLVIVNDILQHKRLGSEVTVHLENNGY
uniref:Uncharacterized protein n=1 Tax=Plectus sambesii TaxID=2011161 RepID=A0A914XKG9_9BILA